MKLVRFSVPEMAIPVAPNSLLCRAAATVVPPVMKSPHIAWPVFQVACSGLEPLQGSAQPVDSCWCCQAMWVGRDRWRRDQPFWHPARLTTQRTAYRCGRKCVGSKFKFKPIVTRIFGSRLQTLPNFNILTASVRRAFIWPESSSHRANNKLHVTHVCNFSLVTQNEATL